MLSVEAYLSHVLTLTTELSSEDCGLNAGFGRILSQDLVARFAVPPFSNSAMDGFAVRSQDLVGNSTKLRVIGDIPAGTLEPMRVGRGEAARIMTGAPLPAGADSVVPVEQTDQPPGDVPLSEFVTVDQVPPGKHERHIGEDVSVGQTVLTSGSIWTPAAAAAAASLGYGTIRLLCRPKVAILATGTELVAAGQDLKFGQIPDANSVLLSGLVEQFGGTALCARLVSDDTEEFEDALRTAGDADVIVTSGAVSVGAFEVVRQALQEQISFVEVAMQPGKPQASGKITLNGKEQIVLSLPGNPVSVFVSAWVFLRPLLQALQGIEPSLETAESVSLEGWKTPQGRRQFVPVIQEGKSVRRSHHLGSGSHLIASLHRADALAIVPEDVEWVNPGDILQVFPVRPSSAATDRLMVG